MKHQNTRMNFELVSSDGLGEAVNAALPIDLEGELARIEKEYLAEALKRSGGVKKQAAQLLGLNFRSLRYRLKKYDLGLSWSSQIQQDD